MVQRPEQRAWQEGQAEQGRCYTRRSRSTGEGVQLLDERHKPLVATLNAELEEIFDQAPERSKRLREAAESAAIHNGLKVQS
jgi:hypothetical protein